MEVKTEANSCSRFLKEGSASFIHIGDAIPLLGRPNKPQINVKRLYREKKLAKHCNFQLFTIVLS